MIVDAQTVESRRNGVIEDIVARTGIDEAMIEVLPAAHFLDRATRIAASLELGIAAQRGEIRSKPTPSGKPL
jgi:hypothetical protein